MTKKLVKKPRKHSDYVVISLRIKEPMRKQVEKAAKVNGISMNSEIVNRLTKSFWEDEISSKIEGH